MWDTASAMARPIRVQPADSLNTLLQLVIDLEYEAQDVARIEEADDDDVSREGNLVIEDHVPDARSDELDRRAFTVSRDEIPATDGMRQRPEFAVVVLQDVQIDEAVQSQVDDRLRARGESFDPVLRVPLNRFVRDLLEDGVEDGVADFRFVQGE